MFGREYICQKDWRKIRSEIILTISDFFCWDERRITVSITSNIKSCYLMTEFFRECTDYKKNINLDVLLGLLSLQLIVLFIFFCFIFTQNFSHTISTKLLKKLACKKVKRFDNRIKFSIDFVKYCFAFWLMFLLICLSSVPIFIYQVCELKIFELQWITTSDLKEIRRLFYLRNHLSSNFPIDAKHLLEFKENASKGGLYERA